MNNKISKISNKSRIINKVCKTLGIHLNDLRRMRTFTGCLHEGIRIELEQTIEIDMNKMIRIAGETKMGVMITNSKKDSKVILLSSPYPTNNLNEKQSK